MADTTLTAVPVSTYAGDSLDLLITLADYPASAGWVLTYSFRAHDGGEISFASTASADNHLFNITAATTATWVPAEYKGVGRVALGAKILTVWKGALEVLQDLAAADASFDTRSHARICLDALNAAIEGKASRDVLNTSIAGQTIGRMTWTEMLSAKSYYQNLVDGEVAAENAANGLGNSRNVLIRFGNP